jgi:hypothetical protein
MLVLHVEMLATAQLAALLLMAAAPDGGWGPPVVLLPPAGAATAPMTAARLRGWVVDAHSNDPVVGATVRLSVVDGDVDFIASTDAEGHYLFPELPPGKFNIVIEAKGFTPSRRNAVSFGEPRAYTFNMRLVRDPRPPEPTLDEHWPPIDVSTDPTGITLEGPEPAKATSQGAPRDGGLVH